MAQTRTEEAAVRWLSAQIRERVQEKYTGKDAPPASIKEIADDIADVIHNADWLRELVGDQSYEEAGRLGAAVCAAMFDIEEE